VIPRRFFQRDPLTCARELIGCGLVWGECRGIIVETEAYSVVNDEASHTFVRPSARAFVAKHPPGTAYVYFNYGVHWMLNVLVKGGAEDGFVLFRALEPRRGFALMEQRRRQVVRTALCSGPGKLAQALGVTGADHGRDLCSNPATAFRARREIPDVETDLRIGISKAAHLPWRFLLRGSAFVSVRPSGAIDPPVRKRAMPA
jgi:DNA-3-methyladenine glycosylase